MSQVDFRVQQIDHVELFVPDQYEAAKWYQEVFGLEILEQHEHWAATGPLMISSDQGNTMLALFKGEPRGKRPTAGHHRVAFRVDGSNFSKFLEHLKSVTLYGAEGQIIDTPEMQDHDQAWSVYFCDPYGHRYEVTTYDYDFVKNSIA